MERVKKIIHKLLDNNILIFTLFLFFLEIIFKYLAGHFVIDYSLIRIFLSSYIISFIVNAFANKVVLIITSIIVTIYSFIQLGFYNYLGIYMSFNTSSQLGKVKDYISDYIESIDLKFFFIFIPLALFCFYLYHKKNYYDSRNFINISLLISFIFIYYLTISIPFMQNKFQTISTKQLLKYSSNPSLSVSQLGVSTYLFTDIKSKVTGNKIIEVENKIDTRDIVIDENNKILKNILDTEENQDIKKITTYFYSQEKHIDNEYTGVFKDKNLIVIMMESITNIIDQAEYFPNLSFLYRNGLSFNNNYSPRNSCATGNNEFSALTSLYSINNMCSANVYQDNSYMASIFNIFNNNGYETSSYHNYNDHYYYRNTIHKNMGSKKYFDVDSLNIDYVDEYKEWPSDVELIEKSFDIYSKDSRFMTFLTTVTSHQPYNVSSEYGDKYLDLFEDLDIPLSVKRYYSKVKELDLALGRLIELLKEKGIYDDTVIVLFGDHYPYGLKTRDLQKVFDYNLENNLDIEKTPFVIYNSNITPQISDKFTSYINILPTLANMFGLDYDSRYYMGEDIFSSNYSNTTYFTDGSWQNSKAFYDALTGKINYLDENNKYTDQEIIDINNLINTKISISNLIIKNDYFKYLENKINNIENPYQQKYLCPYKPNDNNS